MASPINFPSTTPVIGLPLLFTGQAQKEFTLNQSLSVIDALLPGVVVDSLGSPPSEAIDSECYRVTSPSSGEWTGKEENIAVRIAGGWQFLSPFRGLRIFDKSLGACLFYDSQWQAASEPDVVSGGAIVDVEARVALDQILGTLRAMGILPPAI